MNSVSHAPEDWFVSTPVPHGDGFARAICGVWRGEGFSLVVGPSRRAGRSCFPALHHTTESLSVTADRGSSTLRFERDVTDSVSGRRLVREAGMWPQVRVATLRRGAARRRPASHRRLER